MNEQAMKENHISVAVITTSGSWPATGFLSIPVHQKIRQQLNETARELRLTDTSNWVAKVGGAELNPDRSYEEEHLTGEVSVDFGPREGGGGRE